MAKGIAIDWRPIDPKLTTWMARGLMSKEIAARLGLHPSTVNNRIDKLGLRDLRRQNRRAGTADIGAPPSRERDDIDAPAEEIAESAPVQMSAPVRCVSSGTTYARGGRMTLPRGWGGSFGRVR
ncbi:MAG: hypothetical protein ABF665_06545 [Gluconacetobacter sp.]